MALDEKKRSLFTGQGQIKLAVLAATVILAFSLPLRATPDDAVPYPTGYRQWVHVKTVFVGPKNPGFANNGGVHHIYANEKAMEGYRTGKFPDGSVVVADFLETVEPPSPPGITAEGPRRRIDVMVKDSTRYADTSGWGYESFRGDSQTDRMVPKEAAARCVACHSSRKDHDYVFSEFRK